MAIDASVVYTTIIAKKGINKRALEEALKLSNGAIQKAIDRKSILKQGTVELLLKNYPDLNRLWLEAGIGEPFNESDANGKISKSEPGKVPRRMSGSSAIDFYDVDFEAGRGIEFYDDIRSAEPAYIMDVPDFAGCTAFRSYGKSMQPLIDSGAILFATNEDDWLNTVEYGQMYGIVCIPKNGATRRYLKWVRRAIHTDPKTHFRLISANPDYDEMEIEKSKIKSMWLIHGWINKNT